MQLPLKIGEVYCDANGDMVVMLAEHPWTGIFIGALRDGTVRKYYPDTGRSVVPYGGGRIVGGPK